MAIIRPPQPTDGYFQVRRTWIRDPRTTYKGKGILAAILSHDEAWDLTTEQLIAQSADGKAAVHSGLRELEEVGYLKRVKLRRTEAEDAKRRKGTFSGYDYELCEPPDLTEKPHRKGIKRVQPKRAGRTAATTTLEPVPGPDQGLLGSTTNRLSSAGSSSAGSSSAGGSATKKTQGLEQQAIEDQVLGDQLKTPPAPRVPRAQVDKPPSPQNQGGNGSPNEHPKPPDLARQLVDEIAPILSGRGEVWKYLDQRIRATLTELEGKGHPFAVIRLALLHLANGRYGPTSSPKRVLEMGGWWDQAYAEFRASPAGYAPAPSQRTAAISDCDLCDPHGWLLEPGTSLPADPAVKCRHKAMAGVT